MVAELVAVVVAAIAVDHGDRGILSLETTMPTAKRPPPARQLRIQVQKVAAKLVFGPAFAQLAQRHPDLHVELASDDRLSDFKAEGFDAAIRLGEALEPDVYAVPVSSRLRTVVVGAPEYFERHPAPTEPRQLSEHNCIAFRWSETQRVYAWAFRKGPQSFEFEPVGTLTVDDGDTGIVAALAGAGLTYTFDAYVRAHLESGRLVRVLDDWGQDFDPYFLYAPRQSAKADDVRALADLLRSQLAD